MKQKQYLVIDGDTLSRESLNLIIKQVNPDSQIANVGSFSETYERISQPKLINHAVIKIDSLTVNPIALLVNFVRVFDKSSVLILTANNTPSFIHSVIEAGAHAVVDSSSAHGIIVNEIRNMDKTSELQPNQEKLKRYGIGKLTERQKQVMGHIMQGQANKHIAWELGVSEGTIKLHVSSILRALRATNRTQAAIKYRQLLGISNSYVL